MANALMGFVGDVLVNREQPEEAFRQVRPILREPNILFANLEGSYTDCPHPSPNAYAVIGAPAHNLDIYADVGFNVVSMASNHVLDMGYEAMLETRARLRSRGVSTCGVGDSARDAREPALLEAGGLRVAFLGYSSFFPVGYEARGNTPGLCPVRAYNFFRDSDPTYVPGGMPIASAVPDDADFANLAEDIRRARERADVVVTSFHWGEYSRPFYLTDHEKRTARYSIDHGADMVVGHHHHTLRGMEWYKGKPIMYGLGNFVFDCRLELGEEVREALLEAGGEDVCYNVGPRKGWPLLPLHKDARMTVFAWAMANRDGVSEIGFLPCRLTPDGLVHPLSLSSTEGQEVITYLDKCNRTQKLNGIITGQASRPIGDFQTLRVIPT